jgi:hypothetical protein
LLRTAARGTWDGPLQDKVRAVSPAKRRSCRISAPCALLACAAAVAGCVGSVVPRLPESVAAALVATPMRRLESPDLLIYYPASRHDEAVRFLSHVESCVARLRELAQIHNGFSDEKIVVILPELPFNNAFVASRALGYEAVGVVPTYNTTDAFSLEDGLPPDPSAIACHELTHYVHFQQIAGFADLINSVFGQAYSPQIGLDPWFDEGLAVYYEGRLQPGIGRLAWPFWQGAFAAGVAGRHLGGGDLSVFNRDFHGGNHYLIGSEFVSFLAARYGEDKLWKLIGVQASSIFFPLWLNVRFWQAYDKSLSTLIDEFAADVQARRPIVTRPLSQRVLRDAGHVARYARAANGTEALIVADYDRPSRLQVIAADGRVLVDRDLTDVVPPRALAVSSPSISGGLSFTADGRALYFVALDQDVTYEAARLLRFDVEAQRLSVVNRDLRGLGGSVSPDGRRYLFPRADGDHHDLAELDLGTGVVRVLAAQAPGSFVAQPRLSPDGKRLVAATFDVETQRFGLDLFDGLAGHHLQALPTGTMQVTDASWVDDERIVFLGSPLPSEGFQVYLHDLRDGSTKQVTHAPYLAFAPQGASGQTVRFLNRLGWGWTLDEVPLPERGPAPAPIPVTAPAPAPVTIASPDAGTTDAETSETSDASAPSSNASNASNVSNASDASDAGTPPPSPVPPDPAPVPVPTPAPPRLLLPPAWPPLVPQPSWPPILSDGPYSPLDRLFWPSLYGPAFAAAGRNAAMLGLALTGGDRLERHRWTIAGYYQPVSGLPSVSFAYSNRQLAPYTLTLSGAQFTVRDTPFLPAGSGPIKDADFVLYRRERTASLDLTRTFYENPVTLGASFIESYRPHDLDFSFVTRRLAGPHLSATYVGAETTPYTGTRRLLFLSTDVAAYPADWSSLGFGIVDARAELAVTTPLPLLRRQTLTLDLRGHELAGASDAQSLMQVGGLPANLLWQHDDQPARPDFMAPFLPPGVSFFEPLRGFEDTPLPTNRIAIADLSYRYRFIVDWGTASSFGLLPAFFLRQVDLNLFGVAAREGWTGAPHEAAGAALILRTAIGPVPISVTYQIARRRTDDQGLAQLVALALM